MYSITVNGGKSYKAELNLVAGSFTGIFNGKDCEGDLLKINDHQYHLLHQGKSYTIEVLKMVPEEKTMLIKINSVKYSFQLKDKYDELLHNLGMDKLTTKKVNEVKAPMPGMVLNILVSEGATVKKGDALLVLEAMKMENIIKSPADGVVKKVAAIKGAAVEKNQLLIQF